MKKSIWFVAFGALVWLVPNASASMLGFKQLKIDFTRPKDATKKARWSPAKAVKLSAKGLGVKGHPATSRSGWIRTKPLALGVSWRPTRSASLKVTIAPAPTPVKLANGQTYTPYIGAIFARYSPDKRSWSSWQALQRPAKGKHSFRGVLLVPRISSKHYDKLLYQYTKRTDVPWRSDEEALVRELLKRNPRYFETRKPFIGYVQIMWEGSFRGNRPIKRLDVQASFAVSGRHYRPKNPKTAQKRSGPWRLVHPRLKNKRIP